MIKKSFTSKYTTSGEIRELRRDIEMTNRMIQSQNITKTSSETVENLRDRIKELEGARNDRMGIYLMFPLIL